MNDSVLCAHDGPVVTLTLNRPSSLNALDEHMIEALVDRAAAIAADASVRCVIVTGSGKHFMAGGDIGMLARRIGAPAHERDQYFDGLMQSVHAIIELLQRMPQPVIASVRGAVAGFGLSLACACDLVIAADDCVFTSAYRHLGLTPDGGLSYFLPRVVGVKKAMEIVLLGDRFDAAEALRIGLINRIVPQTELAAQTRAVAALLTSGPAVAIRNGKRLVNASMSQPLAAQLAAEATSFGACAATGDFAEGIAAFLGKRPPRFGAN
jgi:2-(1,2-epoxy-1,2-dihydrophenyl)acetyl-CoA isomerase